MIEVGEFYTILNKAAKILKIYSNTRMSMDEVLDDIYNKVKDTDITNIINLSEVVAELSNLSKPDIISRLSKVKKSDLLQIALELGLKMSKGQRSEVIIEGISNYFSYGKLDSDMAIRQKSICETAQLVDSIESRE